METSYYVTRSLGALVSIEAFCLLCRTSAGAIISEALMAGCTLACHSFAGSQLDSDKDAQAGSLTTLRRE